MRPSLKEIKRRTLKPVDAWWTVLVVDPVAVRLVWLVKRFSFRVAPGFVTFLSLLAGLLAGYLFFKQSYLSAAISYEVSFLLDCMDGKLSRLDGTSSRLGAFWDGAAGEITYVASVVGLGAGLAPQSSNQWPWAVTTILLGFRAINNLVSLYSTAAVEGVHSAIAAKPESWLFRHRLLPPLAFPDRHLLLFVVGPIAGISLPMMVGAAVLDSAIVGLKARQIVRTAHEAGVANR